MTPDALNAYRVSEAAAVRVPYIGLAAIVTLLAIGIYFTKFPKIEEPANDASSVIGKSTGSIWAKRQLPWAVIAQFFYVGAQVGIWSYFINFAQELGGVGEKTGANYLGFSLMGFMIGRFIGTFLMRFVKPNRLLSFYAIICAALCGAGNDDYRYERRLRTRPNQLFHVDHVPHNICFGSTRFRSANETWLILHHYGDYWRCDFSATYRIHQ